MTYKLKSLPLGTVVLLENGYKGLVFRDSTPEFTEGEHRILFLTDPPEIMWKQNHDVGGCRVVDILGKFSGGINEV